MAVGAVDGAENRPHRILVRHVGDLVAGTAPQSVVVDHLQLKRNAAPQVATARVRFIEGHLRAFQHHFAQRRFVAHSARVHRWQIHNRPDKADLHRLQFRAGLGDRAPGACVFRLQQEEFLVRLHA